VDRLSSVGQTLIYQIPPISKASFQVNCFGGAELIRTKEMNQL
jgi:hypothetical protein